MELPELLLIDKPFGVSSFGLIRLLRQATGIRKFGHAGTLDPRATGLMLIGVEKGTKRLAELVKLDKEYVALIRLGESRTTGDLEGKIVTQKAVTEIFSAERISATVATLIGTLRLPVSAYSAIKKAGVPMYKRARAAASRDEVVSEVPIRDMTIYEAEVMSYSPVIVDEVSMLEVSIRFKVASGVYIRSLAEELGKRFGYPATLAALRRTQVGEYRIENAQTLDSFTV